MAKGNYMWLCWVTVLAGLLYLLAAWVPNAFNWWEMYFPWYGVALVLVGLWGVMKK